MNENSTMILNTVAMSISCPGVLRNETFTTSITNMKIVAIAPVMFLWNVPL